MTRTDKAKGWRYISSLHSADKPQQEGEKAVHCCDPALSVLVMLVSRNVFLVESALQFIVFLNLLTLVSAVAGID